MGENRESSNFLYFFRKKAVLFSIALASLLGSCKFEPVGINNRVISPSTPDIDLIILDSSVTNYMRGSVDIAIQPVLNGKTFIKAELYIDSSTHPISGWNSFPLHTADYPDGEHILRFFLYTSTNSGSLADILGAEVFVVEKEYHAYFFNEPIEPLTITSVIDTLGTVKISWEKYEGPAFQNYTVKRSDKVNALITDQNQTSYFDNQFLAGYGTFYIALNVAGEEIMSYGASHQAGVPRFASSELIEDSTKIKLTWNRCKYDSALSCYQIIRHNYFGSLGDSVLANIYDINDTTLVDDNPIFGGCFYRLRLIPRQGEAPLDIPSIYPDHIGKSFPCKIEAYFEYLSSNNSIYNIWPENSGMYLRSYDGSTYSKITERGYFYVTIHGVNRALADVSSNGQRGYVIMGTYSGRVTSFNTTTLYSLNDYDLDDYFPGTWSKTYEISVSDNNRLAAAGQEWNGDYLLGLFDMSSGSLRGWTTTESTSGWGNLQISSSGNYIISMDKMYQLTGDSLTVLADVSANARFSGSSDSFIDQTGTSLRIIQLPGLNVISDIQLIPDALFSDYDPLTGLAGCDSRNDGFYYIIDLYTGEIKKSIPISRNGFRFLDGALFTGSKYLKLDL